MRKLYTLLSILFFSIAAQGQLIFHEPFNYTPDATQGLQNQSGNVWVKLNSGDSILVRPGSLSYPGLEASTGNHIAFSGSGTDYYRSFASQNAGTVYRSFILKIDSLMTLGTAGGYFNSFVDATTTTSYGSAVWLRASTVPGKFNIGISLRSNSTPTWVAADFDSLQNYFIVASYDLVSGTANDTARLWINTTGIGGAETVATAIAFGGTDLSTIGKVLVRQDNPTNTPAIRLDEIRVGTNWASVTPSGVVVGASVTAGTLADFGIVTQGLSSASQSLTISGSNLTGAPGVLTITAPSQYQVSTDNINFSSSITVPYTSATLSSTTIYVRFVPQSPVQVNGNISITGGGLVSPVLVAVSGTGAPLPAPVATAATSVSSAGFTANWNAVAAANNYFLDVYTMTGGSSTTTIAGWSFDTTISKADTADLGNNLNQNIQVITLNGSTGTISHPAGPTNNAGPNSYSISANGWDNGVETKYWQVNVNTTGATGITVSSMQGSSNTGPRDFKIQYRVGSSGTWTDVPGGTVPTLTTAVSAANIGTWGVVIDLPLPATADNQPLVSIRWTPTSTTAINGSPVASGGTSRISAINIKGTVSGGTTPAYVYQNVSTGNVTSYNVTGLAPATTYYYVVRASNSADTSVNSNEISVTTLSNVSPTLGAAAIQNFGAQCLNSNTIDTLIISGSNLTAGNITLSALAGFEYATTQAGPYSSTLSISQPGGSFSQIIYVRFQPTMVQSYSGVINISGGGASTIPVNVIASGVNAAPSVTTLNNGAVTNNSAVFNGLLDNGGCSAVSAFGFEYSTSGSFPQGSGTAVSAVVLTGGNFTATVNGLLPATTYYYRALASNSGGVGYGGIDSFTTAAAPPAILTATTLSSFGNVCVNTPVPVKYFILSGSNLAAGNLSVQAVSGYSYSLNASGPFTSALTIPVAAGSYNDTVFVNFTPLAAQAYNGNISVTGGGATAIQVAVQGTGVSTPPNVTTVTAIAVGTTSAILQGTLSNPGCSPVISYGIEYSSINNFTPGTGISVPSNNINSGTFNVSIDSLLPGATYYFRAYASNSSSTAYGNLASFTMQAIGSGLVVGPNPVAPGAQINVSKGGLQPGYHAIVLTNTAGVQVYTKPLNITGSFINETFNLPISIASGTYVLSVVNGGGVLESKLIVIL